VPRKIDFQSLTPRQVFIRASLICGLAITILFGLSLQRIEPLPLNPAPLRFEAQRAFQEMKTLSKNFPNRVTWGENRVKAGKWLKSQLEQWGYQPKSLKFSEVIAGKQYTDLENIYVEKLGKSKSNEIIVAMAHYDITDTTIEGAMDDASGVGVVLELARSPVFINR
jgi:Peptidase family M28